MIRIGICDDSSGARRALHSAAGRILERRGVEYEIYEFSHGEGLLHWLEKHRYEIELVFLDIEMQGINGMDAAKAIREADGNIMLAFVTAYDDFVFDGYSVGALGYVMKPPEPKEIEGILSRALGRLFCDSEQVFICRNSEGIYRIPKRSILYFYSEKRKVTCVTEDREYTFYGKLDDVSKGLGKCFVRIHQRYLVRAAAIVQAVGSTVTVGDKTLPVSRAQQASALAAIARAALDQDG